MLPASLNGMKVLNLSMKLYLTVEQMSQSCLLIGKP